jgi:hypothetical protein
MALILKLDEDGTSKPIFPSDDTHHHNILLPDFVSSSSCSPLVLKYAAVKVTKINIFFQGFYQEHKNTYEQHL